MDDILFLTPSYYIDIPINNSWDVLYLESISNYFVIRIKVPERISIS
jgi:hypothetical protein